MSWDQAGNWENEVQVMVSPKSGPMKGCQFEGLLDFVHAQDELRALCDHKGELEYISGSTPKRGRFSRVYCVDCGGCVASHYGKYQSVSTN